MKDIVTRQVRDRVSTRWGRMRRIAYRPVLAVASMAGVYFAFLLLGFVPVNLDYEPPSKGAVRIFIRSNEVHTDLVVPIQHDGAGIDWRELFPPEHFSADVRRDEYVAIGWGNRRFFVETPRWADFKISAALGALFWPSESVLHVEYMTTATPGSTLHAVELSPEQYRELADFVESTIARSGAVKGIPNSPSGKTPAKLATTVSYHARDRFYGSTGRYHLFNTCNQWTGRGLKRAGVPTGIWTPLKPQVLLWLPTEQASPAAVNPGPAGQRLFLHHGSRFDLDQPFPSGQRCHTDERTGGGTLLRKIAPANFADRWEHLTLKIDDEDRAFDNVLHRRPSGSERQAYVFKGLLGLALQISPAYQLAAGIDPNLSGDVDRPSARRGHYMRPAVGWAELGRVQEFGRHEASRRGWATGKSITSTRAKKAITWQPAPENPARSGPRASRHLPARCKASRESASFRQAPVRRHGSRYGCRQ